MNQIVIQVFFVDENFEVDTVQCSVILILINMRVWGGFYLKNCLVYMHMGTQLRGNITNIIWNTLDVINVIISSQNSQAFRTLQEKDGDRIHTLFFKKKLQWHTN